MRGAREQYVRPPLLATEAASAIVAVWRFRIIALLLLLGLTLGVVLLFLHFSGVTAEDPGLGGTMRQGLPVQVLAR